MRVVLCVCIMLVPAINCQPNRKKQFVYDYDKKPYMYLQDEGAFNYYYNKNPYQPVLTKLSASTGNNGQGGPMGPLDININVPLTPTQIKELSNNLQKTSSEEHLTLMETYKKIKDIVLQQIWEQIKKHIPPINTGEVIIPRGVRGKGRYKTRFGFRAGGGGI